MIRHVFLAAAAALTLAACAPGPGGYAPTGPSDTRVLYRMLDAVNALRTDSGVAPLELNSSLQAAAATHARDMSVQNRPWNFGSDGSSPLERAQNAGYQGRFLGQTISESYEDELQTLSAWLEEPGSRDIILDPEAREMGFARFQEPNGKNWWTMVVGTPEIGQQIPVSPSAREPTYAGEPQVVSGSGTGTF